MGGVQQHEPARGISFEPDSRESGAITAASAEEQYRLVFEQAPIGIAIVTLDGRFARVNDALCAIVGYSREELNALTFQAITHPDDLEADLTLVERLTRGELPSYQLAKRYVRKDGTIVPIELTGSVVRDAHGAPLHYVAHVVDATERQRAEQALRRSEERARALIEQAPDGFHTADLDGRCIDVNAALCRMLGYTRDELLGTTIMDLIQPTDVPRLMAHRAALMVPGTTRTEEWTVRRKDGSTFVAEVSAAILFDGRWQAFLRDVSERKRAEEALRRSEESLARAQKAAHVGSFDWDLRTSKVVRSAEFCSLLGYSPDSSELPSWALSESIHPDDRELVRRTFRDVESEGHAYRIEHRIRRPDGTEGVVLHQGDVVKEADRVVRIVGTMLDITERKRAEQDREEAYGYLRAVLEQCPVGILLVRGDDKHVEPNARALELIGRPIEWVGQYPELLLSPEGEPLPIDERPLPRALRGQRLDAVEYLLRRGNGDLLPVTASAASVRDARGNTGAVVVFQDATAAKELERLRAEWSSIVAHDLRQPLNAIALHGRIAARAVSRDPDAATRAIEAVERAVRRLNRMIDDLLDLSRLDAHRMTLSRRPTDLRTLIEATVAPFAVGAPDRAFDVRFRGALPVVDVDPDRIAQVLENLLSNAVKYGESGTAIVVDVALEEGAVAVAVTNRGPGIQPSDMARLFHRFARAEGRPGGPVVKGVGLGLHIVRALVRAHGGDVAVDSVPWERTTFRFTLPITERAPSS